LAGWYLEVKRISGNYDIYFKLDMGLKMNEKED
jgi:hypothetical protein